MFTCECDEFSAPILSYAGVFARCEVSTVGLRRTLERVRVLASGWTTLFRCRECGSFWREEYPSSEHHGGGSPCIYRVEVPDVEHWTLSYQPVTMQFRQQHEDTVFFSRSGTRLDVSCAGGPIADGVELGSASCVGNTILRCSCTEIVQSDQNNTRLLNRVRIQDSQSL